MMKKLFLIMGVVLALGLFLVGCSSGEAIKIVNVPTTQTIVKGELFLLAVPSAVNYPGEILQYMSADKSSQTDPRIKFKRWSTGDTLEYAIVNGVPAGIKLGGKEFKVKLVSPTKMDSPLQVDFDGDGTIDTSTKKEGKLHYMGTYVAGSGLTVRCNEVVELHELETKWAYGTDDYDQTTNPVGGNVTLSYIDSQKVKVDVSGVLSQNIDLGKAATVGVLNVRLLKIVYQAYAGGIHQATLCVN